MIGIRMITKEQLWYFLDNDLINAILFGGERLYHVDEIWAAFDGFVLVGAVTIAPKGEFGNGSPCIVGLRVLDWWRRMKIGTKLMEVAIKRMVERDLVPINVEILSVAVKKLVEKLDPELKNKLIIVDNSDQGDPIDRLEKWGIMVEMQGD